MRMFAQASNFVTFSPRSHHLAQGKKMGMKEDRVAFAENENSITKVLIYKEVQRSDSFLPRPPLESVVSYIIETIEDA